MRLVLAGALVMVTGTALALIRPALMTDEERLAAQTVREQRLRADTRFLSSDLLEGRAPGTRGDRLAREYVAARFEAIGLEPGIGSELGAAGRARRRDGARPRGAARHPRRRERVAAAARRLHRLQREPRPRGARRGRRDRVRGLRHRRPRARLGRLRGRGPAGQAAARHEQRPGERPGAVRREAPPLLRPLGLQVPDGGRARCHRRHRDPHQRLGRLQLVRGAELLVGRAAQPAGLGRSRAAASGLGHRGRQPPDRAPRRVRPRRPARPRREPGVPPGAARRAGLRGAPERGRPAHERERGRATAREGRGGAREGGRRLHGPPRPLRGPADRRRASRPSTTARSTTPPALRPCSRWPRRSRR